MSLYEDVCIKGLRGLAEVVIRGEGVMVHDLEDELVLIISPSVLSPECKFLIPHRCLPLPCIHFHFLPASEWK